LSAEPERKEKGDVADKIRPLRENADDDDLWTSNTSNMHKENL
jgi:hypothetical protein